MPDPKKNAEWRGNEHRNPLFFADWPDLDGKNLPTRIVVGDRLNDAADVLICCDGLALREHVVQEIVFVRCHAGGI